MRIGLVKITATHFEKTDMKPEESEKDIEQRAAEVVRLMNLRYPHPETLLQAENAWELLVATVLAAQCTDARVNLVTPVLFRQWPDIASLAKAKQEDVEAVVRSTGFYRNKAKHLIAAAEKIMTVYGGKVPETMEELTSLPGVARKTANIVLWGAFGRNDGMAVDTHVKRIVFRLGLTKHKDPERVEKDLMRLFPRESWGDMNHRLVWFGRDICDARNPLCDQCEMASFCPKVGVRQ